MAFVIDEAHCICDSYVSIILLGLGIFTFICLILTGKKIFGEFSHFGKVQSLIPRNVHVMEPRAIAILCTEVYCQSH